MPIFDCKCPHCGTINEDVHIKLDPQYEHHIECWKCGEFFSENDRLPPRVGISFKGSGWTKKGG